MTSSNDGGGTGEGVGSLPVGCIRTPLRSIRTSVGTPLMLVVIVAPSSPIRRLDSPSPSGIASRSGTSCGWTGPSGFGEGVGRTGHGCTGRFGR